MLNKRVSSLLMSTVLVGALAVGCGGSNDESAGGKSTITVSGSTSVGPSMELVAEGFEALNEDVNIEIQQLGSSAGVKNAIDGISEIGMSSRDLKDEERAAGVVETTMAIDAIALITNVNNPIKNLTSDQIKGIYTGEITNWQELGGDDAPIVAVSREDGSGTRGAFEEIIGYESAELTKDATIGDGSGNIKSTVEGNVNAVGYVSGSYVDENVTLLSVDGVEMTTDNIKSGAYPVSRPFLLVHKEENLSEKGQEFLDFILSDEGQAIVEEEGLVSVK